MHGSQAAEILADYLTPPPAISVAAIVAPLDAVRTASGIATLDLSQFPTLPGISDVDRASSNGNGTKSWLQRFVADGHGTLKNPNSALKIRLPAAPGAVIHPGTNTMI
jgi:hypothetical protein